MKTKRIAIVAFLLCACMVIGLGYAALSKELTVNGTLHAGARSDLAVWFVDAAVDTSVDPNLCASAELSGGATEALTANMETASMQNVGDKAVAKFRIMNKETVANAVHAKVYNPSFLLTASNAAFEALGADSFYRITYTFVEDTDWNASLTDDEAVTIAADGKSVTDLPPQHAVYLVVTVELIKSVIDPSIVHAANFTLTYTAEAIEVH